MGKKIEHSDEWLDRFRVLVGQGATWRAIGAELDCTARHAEEIARRLKLARPGSRRALGGAGELAQARERAMKAKMMSGKF